MLLGQQIPLTDEIVKLFEAPEGFNSCYYGKTRNGKTRTATADILDLLKRGETVVANWLIDFSGYDERSEKGIVIMKFLTGNKNFYKYKAGNFHYMDPIALIEGRGDFTVKKLGQLVGVHIFIDEGQWVLPSQEKSYNDEMVEKMKLVLHGGHYCRSLNIITQRPSNISKTTRSQINVWHRCVKRADIFGFIIFQRWSIEDMKDDMPVEFVENKNGEMVPNGELKTYIANKRNDPVFKAYNTHAMRASDAVELPLDMEVYETTRSERFNMVISHLLPSWLIRFSVEARRLVARKPLKTLNSGSKRPLKDIIDKGGG